MNVKPTGLVNEWTPDFAGWHYRVEVDHANRPWVISNGALLCLIWPREDGAPIGARLVYLLPSMLEAQP